MENMKLAIKEAKIAAEQNEIPIGGVITKNGIVLASGHNTTIADKNDTHHAEINAINDALNKLQEKNLIDCEMFVTVEPCPMCAGAIINSKIKRVYIGTAEPKSGCFGSITDFNSLNFNHKPEIYIGICEDECKNIMQSFFKNKR